MSLRGLQVGDADTESDEDLLNPDELSAEETAKAKAERKKQEDQAKKQSETVVLKPMGQSQPARETIFHVPGQSYVDDDVVEVQPRLSTVQNVGTMQLRSSGGPSSITYESTPSNVTLRTGELKSGDADFYKRAAEFGRVGTQKNPDDIQFEQEIMSNIRTPSEQQQYEYEYDQQQQQQQQQYQQQQVRSKQAELERIEQARRRTNQTAQNPQFQQQRAQPNSYATQPSNTKSQNRDEKPRGPRITRWGMQPGGRTETPQERTYREALEKRRFEEQEAHYEQESMRRKQEAARREKEMAEENEKVRYEQQMITEERAKRELAYLEREEQLRQESAVREAERLRKKNEDEEKIQRQLQAAKDRLEQNKKLAADALQAADGIQKEQREQEVKEAEDKLKELNKQLEDQAFKAEAKRKQEESFEKEAKEKEEKAKEEHDQEIARLKAEEEKLKKKLTEAKTQKEERASIQLQADQEDEKRKKNTVSWFGAFKNAIGIGQTPVIPQPFKGSKQTETKNDLKHDKSTQNTEIVEVDGVSADGNPPDYPNYEYASEEYQADISQGYSAGDWEDPQYFGNRAQRWIDKNKNDPEYQTRKINKHYGTDIELRTNALQQAVTSLALDSRVLCTLLLDNKVEPTSRSLPRKGKLQRIEDRWFIITVKDEPRVTDHLWLLTMDLETNQKQTKSLGFLNFVRKIKSTGGSESTVFEIKMSGSNANDVLANAFDQTNPKGEFDVLMEEFSLDMTATCAAASSVPEVIATFVQKDTDGKLFHELIASGTTFEGQPLTPDQVPICLPDEHVARLRDGLRARMEHRLPSAELQRIWELQQQRYAQRQEENRLRRQTRNRLKNSTDDDDFEPNLEDWKISESDIADLQENQIDATYQGVVASSVHSNGGFGGVVGYDAYLRSVAEFRETFSALLSNGVRDTEATTNNFVVQFIVPMNIYEETRKLSLQNWASISGTLGRCKTSFIMSVQEQLFRAMLFELNGVVQTTGIAQNTKPPSLPQICALSWLLFYSQLPIFVTKLSAITVSHLQELQTSRNWNYILKEVSRAFVTDIFVKMLPSMLPSNSAGFEKFEIDIVFYIRKYVLPVAEAVLQNVETFIAHSAPSNC